jgi:hypothetical protein
VTVGASFSGGTMERITIVDGTLPELSRSCRNAAECSATIPLSHNVGSTSTSRTGTSSTPALANRQNRLGTSQAKPSTSANAARLSATGRRLHRHRQLPRQLNPARTTTRGPVTTTAPAQGRNYASADDFDDRPRTRARRARSPRLRPRR